MDESDTISHAVTYVLQRVCDSNGWDFGYVFFPDAIKHADAGRITITLKQVDNQVFLSIADDGEGMPVDETELSGMGRRIMRYRAGVAGASLEIQSGSATGTIVTCVLPLSQVPGE